MKQKKLLALIGSICLVLVLTATSLMTACAKPAPATAADFYKGKTIKIIVPGKQGGGTDLSARIVIPYLEQFTGATVVQENRPEGAGNPAVTYMYNQAKPDGLTLGIQDTGSLFRNAMAGAAGAEYEIDKFNYIGIWNIEPHLMVVKADGPYNSVEDLRGVKELKFGSTTPGGGYTLSCAFVIEFLDLDAKIVCGLKGTEGIAMSLAKGEADVGPGVLASTIKFMEQGYTKPILMLTYERNPALPEVPTLPEVVDLSKEQKAVFDVFLLAALGKMMFAPPGTPQDRVEFLRGGLDDIVSRKDFQEQFKSMFQFFGPCLTGAETHKKAEELLELAKEGHYEKAIKLMDKYRA